MRLQPFCNVGPILKQPTTIDQVVLMSYLEMHPSKQLPARKERLPCMAAWLSMELRRIHGQSNLATVCELLARLASRSNSPKHDSAISCSPTSQSSLTVLVGKLGRLCSVRQASFHWPISAVVRPFADCGFLLQPSRLKAFMDLVLGSSKLFGPLPSDQAASCNMPQYMKPLLPFMSRCCSC